MPPKCSRSLHDRHLADGRNLDARRCRRPAEEAEWFAWMAARRRASAAPGYHAAVRKSEYAVRRCTCRPRRCVDRAALPAATGSRVSLLLSRVAHRRAWPLPTSGPAARIRRTWPQAGHWHAGRGSMLAVWVSRRTAQLGATRAQQLTGPAAQWNCAHWVPIGLASLRVT